MDMNGLAIFCNPKEQNILSKNKNSRHYATAGPAF